ncbi:MAG TPA: ABC transporter permease [Bryobacteraceae bacterium]|nr:ABC transporter permease [Bryobacteraceae bacterium]
MNNLRLAFRTLWKSPGFTLVALVTLALGIGVNTAMFTLVNAVLLRPLPYAQPDRLVEINQVYENAKGTAFFKGWSYPRFEDMRRTGSSFEAVAAYTGWNASLTGTGNPERLKVEIVSAAYFQILRTDAAVGRVFTADEDRTPGTHPVVVISHSLWQRRFAGDPKLPGQTIRMNDTPYTVAGVLPEGFRGMIAGTDVWVPMMMAPTMYSNPRRLLNAQSYWLKAFGRLRQGVSVAQAEAATRSADPEIEKAHKAPGQMKWHSEVVSLLESKIDPALRKSLLVLFGAVGFVLLIACANLANLLLSRSVGRQREVAIRTALGASRGALIRQFLMESVVLSVIGGAAGMLIAAWAVDLATSLQPAASRDWFGVYTRTLEGQATRLDAGVIAFNLGVSFLTGVLFGLLPALRASRAGIAERLHSFGRSRLRGALVVAEVALAVVLLAGAGLMIGSFSRLLQVPLGFDANGVATMRIELSVKRYKEAGAIRFLEQVVTKVAANPLVSAVSVSNALPVSGREEATVLGIGREEPVHSVGVHVVAPNFFAALRVPLRQGRLLNAGDRAGSPNVVLINETAARKLFPGESPIGKLVTLANGWGEKGELKEIVGVVGDVKYEAVEKAVESDVYASYLQYPYDSTFLVVRAHGDPAAVYPVVRQAVSELDRDLPLSSVMPMQARVASATSRTRFSAELLGMFAGLAALLAGIGIYGVISYSVAARTREIGIRMALGARAGLVLRSVALEGVGLAALGVALGVPAALAATRVLSTMLFEVKPGDPTTLAAISALLVIIAFAAALIPALRAARVDPMEALRHE